MQRHVDDASQWVFGSVLRAPKELMNTQWKFSYQRRAARANTDIHTLISTHKYHHHQQQLTLTHTMPFCCVISLLRFQKDNVRKYNKACNEALWILLKKIDRLQSKWNEKF